jgi:hypothetical protein
MIYYSENIMSFEIYHETNVISVIIESVYIIC